MTKTEIKAKIKKLKSEIRYEYRKMNCCAYGGSDLMYVYGLEQEVEDLTKQLKGMEE